jgi:hypothetical protein
MKKIIISLITVLLIVVGVLGFRTYVQNREKDNSIVKIGKKNMRINTAFYMEEVPIPFYNEEESEIEKTFNSLVTAPIVKVRDENTDLTKIDDKYKLVVVKEFTNYRDINTIIKELPNLPQEEVRKYLNQNKYEDLIKEDNREQMYSVLLDLLIEENYPQIREWFKQKNISEDEFLIIKNSINTDILTVGLEKIAVLNNFSVLKQQEILRTIVEYINYELLRENRGEIEIKSAEDTIADIKEILGVAQLNLRVDEEERLLQKIPVLKEQIKAFFEKNPDLLKEPSLEEIEKTEVPKVEEETTGTENTAPTNTEATNSDNKN